MAPVSLFIPWIDTRGGARAGLMLASGLAQRGFATEVLTLAASEEIAKRVDRSVSVVSLHRRGTFGWGSLRCLDPSGELSRIANALPAMVKYLRKTRPNALIGIWGNTITSIAWRLAGVETRLVLNAQVALGPIWERSGLIARWSHQTMLRQCYRWAHCIVAVSRGVADEVARLVPERGGRIKVIYNPARPACWDAGCHSGKGSHSFLKDSLPIVIAVGQLSSQKDFKTLIRAFARVVRSRAAQLVILGEGPEREALEGLVNELDLRGKVVLPGYVSDPVPLLAQSAVYVLSSAWEGSPLAMVEAIAVGTPVVATDCRYGPAEILEKGKYGRLVPVGDVEAMAQAILDTIHEPPDRSAIRERGKVFSVDRMVSRYIDALELPA